jgi:hypothetical protein
LSIHAAQALLERHPTHSAVRVVFDNWHQHADTTHGLLRARCERARCRSAAD